MNPPPTLLPRQFHDSPCPSSIQQALFLRWNTSLGPISNAGGTAIHCRILLDLGFTTSFVPGRCQQRYSRICGIIAFVVMVCLSSYFDQGYIIQHCRLNLDMLASPASLSYQIPIGATTTDEENSDHALIDAYTLCLPHSSMSFTLRRHSFITFQD